MMLIALDPNVCIAAAHKHGHSQDLLDEIFEAREYVQLAIDREERAILEEYERILPTLGERQRKYLQVLLSDSSRVESLPAPLGPDRAAYLHDKGCSTPVEPQLIMVCTKQGWDKWVLVVGPDFTHPELRERGIHDSAKVIQLVSDIPELKGITVLPALQGVRCIHDRLHSGLPYPYNQQELEHFLRVRRYRESDQMEFKQPHEDPECPELTRSILQESMESLCAFANSHGGKVLVGVYEDQKTGVGQVAGFPLKYKGRRKTEDQLLRMLKGDEFLVDGIRPNLSSREWMANFIELADGRRVLVLSVEKCDPPPRRYSGKVYYRHGTENTTRD